MVKTTHKAIPPEIYPETIRLLRIAELRQIFGNLVSRAREDVSRSLPIYSNVLKLPIHLRKLELAKALNHTAMRLREYATELLAEVQQETQVVAK